MAWRDPTGLLDAARDQRTPIWLRVAGAIAFLIVAAVSTLTLYFVVVIVLAIFGVVGGE